MGLTLLDVTDVEEYFFSGFGTGEDGSTLLGVEEDFLTLILHLSSSCIGLDSGFSTVPDFSTKVEGLQYERSDTSEGVTPGTISTFVRI